MNLREFGKVFQSKFVGTGPSSCGGGKKPRAAVSQRLRNNGVDHLRHLNLEGSITVKLILNVVQECGQDLFG